MSVGAVNKQTGDRIPTAGMPAIDDALDLTSTNPVQNAIITAALANKQDKTDNNLETTSKTVVGAVNELKSGLTNYEATTNAALALPENTGKNVLPLTIDNLKALNTSGTWSGNAYTRYDITYTVSVDSDGIVTKINANGTSTGGGGFQLSQGTYKSGSYVLNGCPAGGSTSTYYIKSGNPVDDKDTGNGVNTTSYNNVYIFIESGVTIDKDFYPMIRPATITDPTFAPYIPSVESRIEAVESGLTNFFISAYHAAGVVKNENVGNNGLYCIKGDGNEHFEIGFFRSNTLFILESNYESHPTINNNIITMPTAGYYSYLILSSPT